MEQFRCFAALCAILLCFISAGNAIAEDTEADALQTGQEERVDTAQALIQTAPDAGGLGDPAALIGLTLEELLRQFGTPLSVYAVRGLEEWQDDVVFVYDEVDFYIYKDRVWQLGLKSAYGIKTGDTRAAAIQVMQGAAEQSALTHLQYSLQNRAWNIKLRVNFDRAGLVSVIFVYRSDF
jgi:hypothetical protein